MANDSVFDASDPLAVRRVRHSLKARLLEVLRVRRVSPHFVAVTLGGPQLEGFTSASFDDHVKLMLPAPGQNEPALPAMGPDGPQWQEGVARPAMRDYTPRRFDTAAGELEIEFALHGDGPAADWAARARPGQRVGVGGPRGSFVVPVGYDWHLLAGDETALPAIARRLEELPAGCRAQVLLQVADPADRRILATRAELSLQWVEAGDGALPAAVRALELPQGSGYAWAAGEARDMVAVREALLAHGLDKRRMKVAAYWKRGAAGHHENLSRE
ncbi:siderophore-interacting protein [Pigmentiphaga soli]|uniref:Siderophore-interacting protein n=1 Tax=Pigmentiphaga soli TaxID=1007095 RepID=A0ABP8HIM9_9BURK